MPFKDHKFKTLFATQVHPIEASDETRLEAKASLNQLRDLLPPGINPEDEPALLFVAGNLAVGGLINLNDDGLDRDTALAVYKKFEKQQINVEHDRKMVVGYIVHAGLSELGTDRVITEQEARESGKPFNIAVVIAMWRAVSRDLCDYIENMAGAPEGFDGVSLSFEVGFDGYYIASLRKSNPKIDEAEMVVRKGDASFGPYNAALKASKGSGLDPADENRRVYRIVSEGVVPLGGGIVSMPAAFVKGLAAITKKPNESDATLEIKEPTEPVGEAISLAELEEAKKRADEEMRLHEMRKALDEARLNVITFLDESDKKIAASLKTAKTRVLPFTPINSSNMNQDIQSLKERAAKATDVKELNEIVASFASVTEAIVAESVRQEQARKEAESHSAKIEAAKAEAQAAAEQLTKDLQAVKSELEQIKAAQIAAAAEEAFNNRMAALDEVFELDAEERAELVKDIREIASDEAFAKWMDKSKKLMKEKTKDFKKKMADEAKASQDALLAKLTEKGVKAKVTDAGLDIEEIIASAKSNEVSSAAGTIVQPGQNDLKSLAAKAMSGMTIGGKKIE